MGCKSAFLHFDARIAYPHTLKPWIPAKEIADLLAAIFLIFERTAYT